jgi:DNA-binding LacI/PurR family transcriptional regulator
MADVAALAGVSSQTVSRVSMDLDNVRPETRRKVLDAMAELGYSTNVAARALRYGSYGRLGVIAHRIAQGRVAVDAVVREGVQHGAICHRDRHRHQSGYPRSGQSAGWPDHGVVWADRSC